MWKEKSFLEEPNQEYKFESLDDKVERADEEDEAYEEEEYVENYDAKKSAV